MKDAGEKGKEPGRCRRRAPKQRKGSGGRSWGLRKAGPGALREHSPPKDRRWAWAITEGRPFLQGPMEEGACSVLAELKLLRREGREEAPDLLCVLCVSASIQYEAGSRSSRGRGQTPPILRSLSPDSPPPSKCHSSFPEALAIDAESKSAHLKGYRTLYEDKGDLLYFVGNYLMPGTVLCIKSWLTVYLKE